MHVNALRQYWRWFAEHGRSPKTVKNWVVYVAEQFDSETFNRGWNFNGALAVASALTTASPDIKADMGIDFDCAVIQERYHAIPKNSRQNVTISGRIRFDLGRSV